MAVNIKQNADGSAGLQGSDGDDGPFVVIQICYDSVKNNNAGYLHDTWAIFPRRMIVKSIIGVPEILTTNAVTLTINRAPSGTSLAAGTPLHTGTFNPQGAQYVNQVLPLASAATCDIPAGTRIGYNLSGVTGTDGMGSITVTLAPA